MKEKKREERKQKKEDRSKWQDGSDNEDEIEDVAAAGDQAFSDDDLPDDFDTSDPFFVREDGDKKKNTVKGMKKKKKQRKDTADEDTQEKAELSLLMMDEEMDKKKHFSLDKLVEDSGGKKKKKKKLDKDKKTKDEDDFQVELDDPRFSAVYSSHLYNIDPSAPEYKKTTGTEAMIKEKLKRSNVGAKKHKLSNTSDNLKHKKRKGDSEFVSKLTEKRTSSKSVDKSAGDSLYSLVKSVKAKTEQYHSKKKR